MKISDEFNFVYPKIDSVFTATLYDKYRISWENKDGSIDICSTEYSGSDVQRYVDEGLWVIVD